MFLVDEGESGMLLWKRIDLLMVNTERTETKATVNGGVAYRMNAFIPMGGCRGMRL
jgi:hypothetical protein